jgi:hypothetical protein
MQRLASSSLTGVILAIRPSRIGTAVKKVMVIVDGSAESIAMQLDGQGPIARTQHRGPSQSACYHSRPKP